MNCSAAESVPAICKGMLAQTTILSRRRRFLSGLSVWLEPIRDGIFVVLEVLSDSPESNKVLCCAEKCRSLSATSLSGVIVL